MRLLRTLELVSALNHQVRVLVLDEVGMLDALLFDKLEWLARQLRRDGRPFGGLQLIAAGDFLQLPPVGGGGGGIGDDDDDDDDADWLGGSGGRGGSGGNGGGGGGGFCFLAERWGAVVRHVVLLRAIFRQEDAAMQAS